MSGELILPANMSAEKRAALLALDRCTLREVNEIETYHLRPTKRRLALREAAADAARAEDERAAVLPLCQPDPGFREYLAGAVERMVPEEDDEPDEPTPLEVIGPPDAADVIEARAFFARDKADQ